MSSDQYIYTINSTDPEHYNRLHASLDIPNTEYSMFQVAELTTKCSIIILNKEDYFKINDKKYYFTTEYTDLNSESFCEIVDDMIASDGYYCELDTASRIHFFAQNPFELSEATYNVKLLFGLHDIDLPLVSKYNENITTPQKQEIAIQSTGYTLSTPVLYLLSNVGAKTFTNKLSKNCKVNDSLRTAMRINNSFSANYPIVSGNNDYQTVIKSNDLSNIDFQLVDANLHELALLAPLYLTIFVQPLQDEDYNIYKLQLDQLVAQQQQGQIQQT